MSWCRDVFLLVALDCMQGQSWFDTLLVSFLAQYVGSVQSEHRWIFFYEVSTALLMHASVYSPRDFETLSRETRHRNSSAPLYKGNDMA